MSDKNFNPSWEGYMGDFLKGNVGINQLKPQHEFLDTIGLEKALSDNTQYHVVLTIAEAKGIIDDINSRRPGNPGLGRGEAFARGFEQHSTSRGDAFSRGLEPKNVISSVFKVTDPVSTYAGNINDARGLYDVIIEFKRIGITATVFPGANGVNLIHISGYAGLRRTITGTRYAANHPQMLAMGIGQQGINAGIVRGVRFCILFSVGYRIIESIFKDDYTLADFIGNITMDMAKTAIAAAVSFATGVVFTSSFIAIGSIIVVAGVVFGAGIITVMLLDSIDKKYGLSTKLIALLKEKNRVKPRTPEASFQFILNGLGK
ncbi:hypothetical protein [Serratia silvae]|uniref:Channel forming colicins domain-containing protein n=1 Tax=Serratia silvae TaxID=2824122 RepID=A0ABT0K7S0_9GAMM|nr:hypothetical protein [Serratia silvae]MCL1028056.1 hypothetical protein [Serratia silvae]